MPPRYRSSYFAHIWSTGYAAGYYAYLWSEMLDDDAYQWFEDHGGLTRANGDRFRAMVLSKGNTEDLAKDVFGVAGRGAEHRADAEGPRVGGGRQVVMLVEQSVRRSRRTASQVRDVAWPNGRASRVAASGSGAASRASMKRPAQRATGSA